MNCSNSSINDIHEVKNKKIRYSNLQIPDLNSSKYISLINIDYVENQNNGERSAVLKIDIDTSIHLE